MQKLLNILAALVLTAASLAAPRIAAAADALQDYSQDSGPCGDQRFLHKIVNRFDYQVKHVPNLPQVAIVDFSNIHERRYEPADGEVWPIERRYCNATVALSDGATRDIRYLIEGRMGYAGIGSNVEFCVSGFDRWFVYNGYCRVLR